MFEDFKQLFSGCRDLVFRLGRLFNREFCQIHFWGLVSEGSLNTLNGWVISVLVFSVSDYWNSRSCLKITDPLLNLFLGKVMTAYIFPFSIEIFSYIQQLPLPSDSVKLNSLVLTENCLLVHHSVVHKSFF